ncbi:MAG: nickel pincer cofactor biosynthesis protein LarB [Oscillospiraceae bacterium]|jgi:NCAIR mutase (PurE)-related protein|nr:nickel pincer cofactor biosynthesis protein LarB [Oscillospiraceae bacterium]
MNYEDLGYAKVDHHRAKRTGEGEVVYGESKTPEQILGIASALANKGAKNILVTRLSQDKADILAKTLNIPFEYHASARIMVVLPDDSTPKYGKVVVACGGTSDIGVCEEAAITAETLGSHVERLYDVGVAGLHRLLHNLDVLEGANCVIAVAGMEGALASVIGGLADCPVVGVPTSVGYGASFGGLAALLAMLNSCASGVSVVNIDNGFGAGFIANRINRNAKSGI